MASLNPKHTLQRTFAATTVAFDIFGAGNFMSTTIREILGDRRLFSVKPEATLRHAAKEMSDNTVGAVAVIDGDQLAGIVTERDIVFRCIGRGFSVDDMTAAEVMTRDPVTVDIDEAISQALAAKLGGPFRHLPVMEQGQVIGILSYRDIPTEYVVLFERFRAMKVTRTDGLT